MNPTLKKLVVFVRDLMSVSESTIKIGRENAQRENFKTLQIVVDMLADIQHQSVSEDFDGEGETLTLGDTWGGTATLTFFGDNAMAKAREFSARCRSEAARTLRKSLGLSVAVPSAVVDVKALTGSQYSEEVELTVNVVDTSSVEISTKRIDTAQIEGMNETKDFTFASE